jgi:hypothetical protein
VAPGLGTGKNHTTRFQEDPKLVSAEDHVSEPKDTWQARLPAKLRDQTRKLFRPSEGDAWVIDGKQSGPLGLGVQADTKFEDYRPPGETYQTIRKGADDPYERGDCPSTTSMLDWARVVDAFLFVEFSHRRSPVFPWS